MIKSSFIKNTFEVLLHVAEKTLKTSLKTNWILAVFCLLLENMVAK